jgi:metal-sulfur cluster biosynthetic enzyme
MTQTLEPNDMPSADSLREALRTVIDPEAGMNIVDLGLIYGVEVAPDCVHVDLTMTTPSCPMSEMIIDDCDAALRTVLPAGCRVNIELVWSPPWEPSMMTDKARQHFGW